MSISMTFSSLPKDLQSLVLKSINYPENLKVLKLNKTLRKYSLENGPFTGKILKFYLEYGIVNDIDGTSTRFCFRMQIFDRHRNGPLFLIGYKHLKIDQKMINFSDLSTFQAIWLFVNKITSCEEVYLFLQERNENVKPIEVIDLFGKIRVLPKLRIVSRFKLEIASFAIARAVFESFRPRIIDRFDFEQYENDPKMERYLTRIMGRKMFRDCKFFTAPTGFKSLCEAFSKTNAENVRWTPKTYQQLEECLRKIQEFGIPSKNETATVELYSSDFREKFREQLGMGNVTANQIYTRIIKHLNVNCRFEEIGKGEIDLVRKLTGFDEKMEKNGENKASFEEIFRVKSMMDRVLYARIAFTEGKHEFCRLSILIKAVSIWGF